MRRPTVRVKADTAHANEQRRAGLALEFHEYVVSGFSGNNILD